MKNLSKTIGTLVLAGTFLTLALMLPFSVAAETTPVFGPMQYTRTAGKPQTFTETFENCGTASCQIVVTNGNADGSNRVSSASIFLNGSQIVGPKDFNQQVDEIVVPVVLADQNQLEIRLASKPKSFLIVDVQCAASPVILSTGGPGVSLMDSTLLSALPIINTGTEAAQNVELTSITLNDGMPTSPAPLPFNLGTIPVNSSVVLNTEFSDAFAPLGSYALVLEGTYDVGDSTYCFELSSELTVPPAAPGSAVLDSIEVTPAQISGAPFPPQPPSFGAGVNIPRWTVPTAPFVPGSPTPDPTEKSLISFEAPLEANVLNSAAEVIFEANNGSINGSPVANTSTTAEPSGASNGQGVVFITGNWFAAYSTDGGSTFTALNPTTVFPADAVGFCCDQIVQYVPSIDRFIWLLQGNGYRLASASPADIINFGGTAWTYWNLTPNIFGSCSSFDYPDLSVGNDFLYMSWDAGGGCSGGFQVARTSLAGLQAGGTITIGFTTPSDGPMAWGSHLMQNTLDEIFWAGHNNNSQMRVFSLAEDSNTYFWRDIGISSWANNSPLSSTTPDGQNWVNFLFNPTTQNPGGGFPSNSVLGSTRVGNRLWFAWSAGTDDNFQQPHVEMVTLDRSNDFSVIQQVQIWNNDYAFAYPALATNACTGEVGLSLEYGGDGNYENHVVGFWGDFVVYITTGSDVGTTRYGDYVTIRQEPATDANPGNLFSAFGYGLNSVAGGTQTDVHHVLFGRPASSCIIIK